MFVTSIIVGTIGMRHNFTVTRRPFYRDVLFYILAVALLFYVLYYGQIKLIYALGEYLNYIKHNYIVSVPCS